MACSCTQQFAVAEHTSGSASSCRCQIWSSTLLSGGLQTRQQQPAVQRMQLISLFFYFCNKQYELRLSRPLAWAVG